MDSLLKEKYKTGGNTDSIMADCAIYFLTMMEQKDKWECNYYQFFGFKERAVKILAELTAKDIYEKPFFEKHIKPLFKVYFNGKNHKQEHQNSFNNEDFDIEFFTWAIEETAVFEPCQSYRKNGDLMNAWNVQELSEKEINERYRVNKGLVYFEETALLTRNMLTFE